MSYVNYTVNDREQFDSANYLAVVEEITEISKQTLQIPGDLKADILISFTKNHSLKMSLLNNSPRFAEMITGGFLPVKHIETLFEASSKNYIFATQLEDYLRSQLKA